MNKRFWKNSTRRSGLSRQFFKRHAHESSGSFTLIELLVVILTIAILAATLIPAFASVRPNTLGLQCMNNLRQWGAALRTAATDNNEVIARDGTDDSGVYAADSGVSTGPGSPNDTYAWFNVAPTFLGEKPLSYYWNTATGGNIMPFPGRQGKIWHCPAAKVASADAFIQNGQYGFFSYALNLDLKATTPITSSYSKLTYPLMPKFGTVRNPSSLVLLTDTAFSPTLEPLQFASDSSRNGTFPAARSYTFPSRHNGGGTLLFIDGHASIYQRSYVTNGALSASGANRAEKPNPDIWWDQYRL